MDTSDLKKDFKRFLFVIWRYLELPRPTKVQYEIADTLNNLDKNLLIEAFRGLGKSWITSAYVVWRLWKDNQLEIMVVSATGSRSEDFARFTKNLISNIPFLKEALEPRDIGTQKGTSRWSQNRFDVLGKRASHSPSVKSVGVTGQLTGSRADLIIADDIEIPGNSATVDMRSKLLKATNEFTNVLKPHGNIIYLGTPQSEESIYNTIRKRKAEKSDELLYLTRIWPVEGPKKVEIYDGDLAPSIHKALDSGELVPGEPVDPERFDELVISGKRAEVGSAEFALQYMLDTTLSDIEKYPLKLNQLVVTDLEPDKGPVEITHSQDMNNRLTELPQIGFTGDYFYREKRVGADWEKYTEKIMVVDISGRGKDETAYVILGKLFGKLFLLDLGGYDGGYEDQVLSNLANKAAEHKVNKILVEENFGDGMFTKLFTPVVLKVHRTELEEVKNYTQKEKRIIDTLEPLLANHKLIVSRGAVEKDLSTSLKDARGDRVAYSLFYQLTHVTYDRGSLKHDDRLDALAMGCRYFVDQMVEDEETSLKRYRDKEIDRAWEDFSNQIQGGIGLKALKRRKPESLRDKYVSTRDTRRL